MFETILLPVDGSDSAKRAATFGRDFAQRYDAHIDVLYALEGQSRLFGETGDRDPKEQGRKILDEIGNLVSEDDIMVDTHLVEGQPHEAITDRVDENDVDLVVMGRHGRSGLRERLLGTVTDRVLRQTNVPVLTVSSGNTESPTGVEYDNILITTDGSENAERAAPYGATIAQHVNATLHLLNVIDVQSEAGIFDAGGVTDEFIEQLETEGRKATERLTQHIDEPDITVQSSLMRGISHEAIDEYATKNGIDLIVMASTGESNLAGQSLGSVTDRVLRIVDVPVLVISSGKIHNNSPIIS